MGPQSGGRSPVPPVRLLEITITPASQARKLLKAKHNQTQIIEMLWNCTKGGSKAYELWKRWQNKNIAVLRLV
ncbi:MAG: hypothetical protein GDA43_25235 [Hormoscilla sp. SP5CHS1]|nr:hypothetical protein [Hormoscilla sp. SP12CHS1]MBC6456075.1 hypothetical protein [Hormoscilla sp. SP5CHS1]